MAKKMKRASEHYPNAGTTDPDMAALMQAMSAAAGNRKATAKNGAPAQHTSWWDKKKAAGKAAAKRKAKESGQAAGSFLRAEARSTWHRNKTQAAPWLLAAPYAVAGEAAAQALGQNPTVGGVAVAGVAAAATGVGSAAAWKWKLAGRVPTRFARRVRRGMAVGCAWCCSMPLLAPDVGQPSMWAAGLLGTVALSASWWQHHRPGHPDGPERVENHSLAASRAKHLVAVFNEDCAAQSGPVPGAELSHNRDTDVGSEFRLDLNPRGQVTGDSMQSRTGRVSLMLGVMAGQITFQPDKQHPTVVWMRVTDTAPDATYTGPRILRNGQPCHDRTDIGPDDDVDIVVGPYQDGEAEFTFRVIKGGSVQGGFLLGDKGSGKSALMEALAVGLRWLGIFLIWFDGQGGASSPTLNSTADWPEIDVSDGPDRVFRALKKMLYWRQSELAGEADRDGKYVYDPARPPIIAMVDECHALFNTTNPVTGKTYGVDLGETDRMWRKAGMALIGGSQDCDLKTFGGDGSDVLRTGMLGGNLVVMRYLSKSHTGLLPGNALPPGGVPDGGGFGQAPLGDRPQVIWRGRKVDDAAGWMRSLPPATLDHDTERAAGQAYANRHEQAEVNVQQARQRLADMKAMSAEELHDHLEQQVFGQPGAAGSPARPEPASGPVLRMPGAVDGGAGQQDSRLSERQADMLDLLSAHALSTAQIADHYGVSVQVIRADLTRLGEGRLEKVDRGVYRARRTSPITAE